MTLFKAKQVSGRGVEQSPFFPKGLDPKKTEKLLQHQQRKHITRKNTKSAQCGGAGQEASQARAHLWHRLQNHTAAFPNPKVLHHPKWKICLLSWRTELQHAAVLSGRERDSSTLVRNSARFLALVGDAKCERIRQPQLRNCSKFI